MNSTAEKIPAALTSLIPVEYESRAEPTHGRSHVAFIAQLVEHCTGNVKGRGFESSSKPEFFQVIFSVVTVMTAFAAFIISQTRVFSNWQSTA